MREVRGEPLPDNLSSRVSSILQSLAFSEPLLPNLKTLRFWGDHGSSVSFIHLFLSPKTTTIYLGIWDLWPHKTATASMITTLSTSCPNLQEIVLCHLPRDPIITTAVSELILTTNRNTLQSFCVDSPLTEEARKVVCELPGLRNLEVVIDGSSSLPTMMLPNLCRIEVEYNRNHDWLQGFYKASLGNLASVTIESESALIDGFLETFKNAALTTSMPTTLSTLNLGASYPWKPSYGSLLPLTQMQDLTVDFSCHLGCSSTIDDDTVTKLARSMPKLESLHISFSPCHTPGGITMGGLCALAHNCPRLHDLSIHFQAATLNPSEIHKFTSTNKSTVPRHDCALVTLLVGLIPVPNESASMVASTLLLIFPHLDNIEYLDDGWEAVEDAIQDIKRSTE